MKIFVIVEIDESPVEKEKHCQQSNEKRQLMLCVPDLHSWMSRRGMPL
jgi:hypothetical protein